MLRRFAAVFFVCYSPTFCSFPAIGHFWVTKTLTFKTGLSAKPCFSVFQTLPGRCDLKLDGKCSTRSMLRRFSAVFFVCYSPTFCSFPAIGHFWVTKTLTFKTRLSAKPCFSVFELYLHENITEKVHIKKFQVHNANVFLLVANSLKQFKRGRGVCIYTTQVNSAFRARWLASSVICQVKSHNIIMALG